MKVTVAVLVVTVALVYGLGQVFEALRGIGAQRTDRINSVLEGR